MELRLFFQRLNDIIEIMDSKKVLLLPLIAR